MPGFVLAEGDAPAMARPRKYSNELRERAVRLYFESNRPIAHVAQDLGIHKEALRQWVRQAEADRGVRRDLLKMRIARFRRARTGFRHPARLDGVSGMHTRGGIGARAAPQRVRAP